MSRDAAPWSPPLRLSELGHGAVHRRLKPDEATRAAIARALDLAALPELEGELTIAPWQGGVEVHGRWNAKVTYTCGITLEPYDQALSEEFVVHAVPADSPLAAPPDPEIELGVDDDDPPDVLEDDRIDLAGLLVEHLTLALDPFPRAPGAVFEPPPPENPESPFAVLKRLKPE